ncbi:MAG TPA: hypothetical protein VG963_04270, partial [Polyangiaceae bacterium]|nr:hypothetical protein [Polyangiaceae bacterium]
DPNDLMRFIGPEGVRPGLDDLTSFLVAQLMHLEGEDDVASVVFAALTEPRQNATGPALSSLAEWVSGDPVLGRNESSDLIHGLEEAAVARDPELWRPQLGVSLAKANTGNLADAVAPLRQLSQRFADVPAVWNALGAVYNRLGWKPERERVTLEMARRFGDADSLAGAVGVYEDWGDDKSADALAARAEALDASIDLRLDRALRRRDYGAALAEVDRLLAIAPYRAAELTRRRQEILLAAGDADAERELLTRAVQEHPESGPARLALADQLLAAGDPRALHVGLAEATRAGAQTEQLATAIDAVEPRSEFAPLRLDGRQVIRDYERAGRHQSGTAERVLDYAAVWVHSDGSSRMLEHEIVRIQSEEAISKFSEHQRLGGLVLNMRVIKKDGRTLEPEPVAGKPTVTFPHLEVGDYIETEHVQGSPAEEQGKSYAGLRWFFREEDVAYARSEFVLIAPVERPLDIEITGKVPPAQETRDGHFITRRWRVDESPAAPVEPLSVPVQEFMPSVRVGWGNGLERRLRILSEQVADTLPVDPRIRDLALSIVAPVPEAQPRERARKAYRWVEDNVKDGPEVEGPRILTSKQGNRWAALRMLLRALDIPVRYAVVKNRLAPPAPGPMSEAEAYNVPLLEVGEGKNTTWLTVQEKYAPFGYVPVEARGMPGHELSVEGQAEVVVPAVGDQDRLEYEGTIQLSPSGTARVQLRQRFVGKYAIRLRSGLE